MIFFLVVGNGGSSLAWYFSKQFNFHFPLFQIMIKFSIKWLENYLTQNQQKKIEPNQTMYKKTFLPHKNEKIPTCVIYYYSRCAGKVTKNIFPSWNRKKKWLHPRGKVLQYIAIPLSAHFALTYHLREDIT